MESLNKYQNNSSLKNKVCFSLSKIALTEVDTNCMWRWRCYTLGPQWCRIWWGIRGWFPLRCKRHCEIWSCDLRRKLNHRLPAPTNIGSLSKKADGHKHGIRYLLQRSLINCHSKSHVKLLTYCFTLSIPDHFLFIKQGLNETNRIDTHEINWVLSVVFKSKTNSSGIQISRLL